MNKAILFLSCLFIFGTISMQAQRFQLREAGITAQVNGFSSDFGLNIMDRLPNSTLVQEGFDRQLTDWFFSDDVMSTFWLGFHGAKDEKHGPVLRLGLLFGNSYLSLGHFENRNAFRLDTLTSGAQTAFLDSVNRRTYHFAHRSTRVGIQAQYLYYWNKENRFSLYAGAGLGFSTHINGNYTISEYSTSFNEIRMNNQVFGGPHSYNRDAFDSDFERFSTEIGYTAFVSIPIGLNFRIGSNPDNFWGKSHMFWEVQPSFNYYAFDTSFPELFVGVIRSFGFRLEW